MRLNLSLKARTILGVVLITTVLYIAAASIIVYSFYKDTVNNTLRYTNHILNISSKYFGLILDRDLEILRTVKVSVTSLRKLDNENQIRNLQQDICRNVLYQTPQFLSLSINWEISALKNNPALYGRIRYTYYKSEGKIISQIDTLETQGDNILGLYYKYKISKKEGMTDPYYYSYSNSDKDKILMTSLFTPILSRNTFEGLVVADVGLEHFYKLLEEIKPFDYVDNFLISHTEKFIAFTNHNQYTNKPITKFFGDVIYTKEVSPNIAQQRSFTFEMRDSSGTKYFFSLHPIKIGNFDKPWYVGSMMPQKVILKPVQRLIKISIAVSSVLLLLLLFFSLILANTLTKFFELMRETLDKLAEGDIHKAKKIPYKTQDELGDIASNINRLIDNLNRLSVFAKEIGSGNLDFELEKLSDHDVLGEAFLEMRRSLKIAKLEDIRRKQEDEIQNWIVQGENLFAQILREYNQDLDTLAYQVISNLVKYTGSAQGGLFIVNDDDPENKYLELIAAYAYDRRKFLEKKIPFGVGLVGRSVLEGETIHITNVPPDYLSITSGLGDHSPSSLLIVPFKFNEIIYAVVELASFEGYRAHVRRFVERIGVSVASTIANVRITQKTQELVKQLRARSQELAAQEEEMRQNLEEMRATQEELRKKASELENVVEALNKISYVLEINPDGYVININDRFLKLLKKRKDEIIGKHYLAVLPELNDQKYFDQLLKDLKQGHMRLVKSHLLIANNDIWLNMAFVPIMSEDRLQKIVVIGMDITQYIKTQNK